MNKPSKYSMSVNKISINRPFQFADIELVCFILVKLLIYAKLVAY